MDRGGSGADRSVGYCDGRLETEEKLLSFGRLKHGWHFGEGEEIGAVAIQNALHLYRCLVSRGIDAVSVCPGLSGEIVLSVMSGDNYLEFEVSGEEGVIFSRELEGKLVEWIEALTLQDVKRVLDRY